MIHILLVCRGNICRSPMALAVTGAVLARSALAPHIRLDTAGTHAFARCPGADPRAIATLLRHGYPAPRQRVRAVQPRDFLHCDQLLAMDCDNLADLQRLCPPEQAHKLGLFLDFARTRTPGLACEVVDPYFGSLQGFERVLRLCETGAQGLLAHWAAALQQAPDTPMLMRRSYTL